MWERKGERSHETQITRERAEGIRRHLHRCCDYVEWMEAIREVAGVEREVE